jgi:hypothetical protein
VEGWPGHRWGSVSQQGARSHAAGRQRLEQAVPPALEEEDERLKKNAGSWMYIQQIRLSETFFLTKLTTPCVGFDLLVHMSASPFGGLGETIM